MLAPSRMASQTLCLKAGSWSSFPIKQLLSFDVPARGGSSTASLGRLLPLRLFLLPRLHQPCPFFYTISSFISVPIATTLVQTSVSLHRVLIVASSGLHALCTPFASTAVLVSGTLLLALCSCDSLFPCRWLLREASGHYLGQLLPLHDQLFPNILFSNILPTISPHVHILNR